MQIDKDMAQALGDQNGGGDAEKKKTETHISFLIQERDDFRSRYWCSGS
jgi:hypothetical protein